MDYSVVLRRRAQGDWLASVDSLPGCAVRARSREAALEEIRAAIEMYIQGLFEEAIEEPSAADVESVESVVVQV